MYVTLVRKPCDVLTVIKRMPGTPGMHETTGTASSAIGTVLVDIRACPKTCDADVARLRGVFDASFERDADGGWVQAPDRPGMAEVMKRIMMHVVTVDGGVTEDHIETPSLSEDDPHQSPGVLTPMPVCMSCNASSDMSGASEVSEEHESSVAAFLAMSDDDRGVMIARAIGHTTLLSDFVRALRRRYPHAQACSGNIGSNGSLTVAACEDALEAAGYRVSDTIVCDMCMQPPMRAGARCCPASAASAFRRPGRVPARVIHGMLMIVSG